MENLKVLVIDDNQLELAILGGTLARLFPGATLLAAQTGQEGLEVAAMHDPDVVVLDILLPGMSGYAVCRRLKNSRRMRDIAVLFLTAFDAGSMSHAKALQAGAEGFLCKPYDLQELRTEILALAKSKAMRVRNRQLREELGEETAEHHRAENALIQISLLNQSPCWL